MRDVSSARAIFGVTAWTSAMARVGGAVRVERWRFHTWAMTSRRQPFVGWNPWLQRVTNG